MRITPRLSPIGRLLRLTPPKLPTSWVRLQPVVVWSLWAAALVWTGIFVARHGHNIPAFDEWAYVPISYSSLAEQFKWLGGRHMEHRFPVARFFFLGLLEATGHDYRAGMWMSLGLLAGTAGLLILAARKLRGYTSVADAVFPILFVHAGHTENLLMGYQIAFTITVFALALFSLVVVRSPETTPGRSALRGAGCLLVVAAGGWLGLVFVPGIGAWVTWQAWRASGERGRRIVAGAVLLGVAVYLAWSGWVLLETRRDGVARAEAAGLAARIRAVAEVTAIGLGPGLSYLVEFAKMGWFLLAMQVATALVLAWVGCRRPDVRPVAWGLLAVLLGGWVFAAGIGYSRGNGVASRYTSFTALGIAVPFLVLARFAARAAWPTAAVVIVAGVLLVPRNDKHAGYQGVMLDQRYESIVADVRSGMPMDVIADRHVDFWVRTRPGWLRLWNERFSLLRDVPPPVEKWDEKPATFRPDGEATEQFSRMSRYRVDFGGVVRASIVRVKFKPQAQTTWEPIVFEWVDPTTRERHRSVVKPWVRPLDYETVFWIDGPIAEGELLIGRPECPIEVLSVWYSNEPLP